MAIPPILIRFHSIADKVSRIFSFIPPLIARIVIAWTFVQTGWGKLHDLETFTRNLIGWGIPFAKAQAPVLAALEFVCGLLVGLGLFTRLASLPLIGIMTVAIITVNIKDVSTISEFLDLHEFLYLSLLTWLAVYGGGFLAADRLLAKLFGKHCITASNAKPAAT